MNDPYAFSAALSQPVSLGNVARKSVAILVAAWVPILVVESLIQLPGVLVGAVELVLTGQVRVQNSIEWIIGGLSEGAVLFVALGALTHGNTSVGHAFSRLGDRLVAIVVVGFLFALVVGLGFVLCVVPGVILMLRYALVVQVAAAEGLPIGQCFSRSEELTNGHKSEIFVVYFVAGLLVLPLLIAVIGAGMVMGAMELTDWQTEAVMVAAGLPLGVLAGTVNHTVSAAIYFNLRDAKDGVGVAQLQAVFE